MESSWKDKLKQQWDENPIQVIVVASFAAAAGAKIIDALSAAQGRRAYARDVNIRDYKARRRNL